MKKDPKKKCPANGRRQTAKTQTRESYEKSRQRRGSSCPRPSKRRFPISQHIDEIMNSCPDDAHLKPLLQLEASYEAASVALQEVAISDAAKRDIAIEQLARASFDHAKLGFDSYSELRSRATAGRHECESRWRENDLW